MASRRFTRAAVALILGAGFLAVVAYQVHCFRQQPTTQPPVITAGQKDHERYSALCERFLDGAVSLDAFRSEARPPCIVEALRQGGEKATTALPMAGVVTLQGQDDHSGTEIAAVVLYDTRALDLGPVIVSPLGVVTDEAGRFDFSSVPAEAWRVAAKSSGAGSPFWSTCYATQAVMPPTAMLYIRHQGFEPRVVRVQVGRHVTDRLAREGKTAWHIGGLELLPAGAATQCYDVLGGRRYPPQGVWEAFNAKYCSPEEVRAHLRAHPDCPVADDGLVYWLWGRHSGFVRDRQAVADGFDLFHERFRDAADNTGLLMSLVPGQSPDSSWRVAIEKMEKEFFARHPASRTAAEYAAMVRKHPDRIRAVPLYTLLPEDFSLHKPTRPAKPPEEALDDDVTYLVYMGLTHEECWSPSFRAILATRDRRAVPILIRMVEAGLVGERVQPPFAPTHALRSLAGVNLVDPKDWLSWWQRKGSRMRWPQPPVTYPDGWPPRREPDPSAGMVARKAVTGAPPAMFRGNPRRTGVYACKALRDAPGSKRRFPVRQGVSATPVLVGGVAWFGGNDGVFYALDLATLKPLWTFELWRRAGSSPALVRGTVFFGTESGLFYALDAATGEVRWKRGAGSRIQSSPLVLGDLVYFSADDGHVYALDLATGDERWRIPCRTRYRSSPAAGEDVVCAGSYLAALDPATGAVRRRCQTSGVLSTPAVGDDALYAGTERNHLSAVALTNGRKRWTFATGGWVESSPAVLKDAVVFGSRDGHVYAVDAASGEERWRFATGKEVTASPSVAEGVVYAASWDGWLYALSAATGELLWKVELGGRLVSSPVPADGLVCIGGAGGLYVLGAADRE